MILQFGEGIEDAKPLPSVLTANTVPLPELPPLGAVP
jgi:hypothetical protein